MVAKRRLGPAIYIVSQDSFCVEERVFFVIVLCIGLLFQTDGKADGVL